MSFHSLPLCEPSFAPPALAQSRLYAEVLRAAGREVQEVDLDACGMARLIVRRAGRPGIALMPGGPLWRRRASLSERRDALESLPLVLRRHRIAALITNCGAPVEDRILRRAGHLPLITGGYEARLDLTAPLAERRARLKGKWRNRLVQAESAGLSLRSLPFSPGNHRWLLDAEAAQRQARRYRGLPLELTALAAQMRPKDTRLFIAMRGSERLGAMLFLLHDGAASYHIGHLSPAGRAVSAHNLLLWQAAGWLAARGAQRLDLGTIETEREAGLARFKLGSGAVPVARGASVLYSAPTACLGRVVTGWGR